MEGAPPSVDTTPVQPGAIASSYTLWPSSWQTSTSGTYTATVDLTGNGLSGNGSWSVYLFNGYGGSAGVQYDASWTISGLYIDGGGSGPGPSDCPPDLDGDGTVTVSDALLLLSDFGCLSNCTADLNGDGIVTTSDMLVFLGAFGEICESDHRLEWNQSPGLAVGAFSYPGRDLNPHGPFGPTEFKSVVSTNSTTRAGGVQGAKQRRKAGWVRASVEDGRDPA